MKRKYKVIALFNAIGVHEFEFYGYYKETRKRYEELKKDDYIMLSIMVNEKGKVLHVFDHTKKFSYNKNIDYFTRKDWYK